MKTGRLYRECPKTFHIPYTPGTSQYDHALRQLVADHPEVIGGRHPYLFVDEMHIRGRTGVYVLKKSRGKSF